MLKKIRKSQNAFAYTLLAPSIILLVALIGYPMIYNIMISVQKVPLNPKLESVFVGKRYLQIRSFIQVYLLP